MMAVLAMLASLPANFSLISVLSFAAGEAREERARALDAVLRISREANDGVVDVLRTEIGAVGGGSGGRNRGGGAAESGGIFLAIRSVGFWCGRGFVHA